MSRCGPSAYTPPPTRRRRFCGVYGGNGVGVLFAFRRRSGIESGEYLVERIRRHERRQLILRIQLHQQFSLPLASLDVGAHQPATASLDSERSQVEKPVGRNLAVLAIDLLERAQALVSGHDYASSRERFAGDGRNVVGAIRDLVGRERFRIAADGRDEIGEGFVGHRLRIVRILREQGQFQSFVFHLALYPFDLKIFSQSISSDTVAPFGTTAQNSQQSGLSQPTDAQAKKAINSNFILSSFHFFVRNARLSGPPRLEPCGVPERIRLCSCLPYPRLRAF